MSSLNYQNNFFDLSRSIRTNAASFIAALASTFRHILEPAAKSFRWQRGGRWRSMGRSPAAARGRVIWVSCPAARSADYATAIMFELSESLSK